MCLKGILLLLIYAVLLNLPYIHVREFQGEEGRRVIIALHMLDTGNWIVPHVEGSVYLNKPPLFNYLIAGMFRVTGNVSEAAARLVSVISAFLCAVSLSLFWRNVSGTKMLWFILPGLFFLTFAEVMGKTVKAEIDITFTLFVTVSLLLWFYFHEVRGRHYTAWMAGLSLAAVSLLTKGVQAPLFFYGGVLPYLLYQRKIRRASSLPHLSGICAFMFIISAWFIPLVGEVGIDRLADTWVSEVWVRKDPLRGSGVLKHLVEFPFSYIISHLPWIPLILLWRNRPMEGESPVLKNVALFSFFCLLFSLPLYWLIPGSRIRYLLPVSGMLSLLLVIPVSAILDNKVKDAGFLKWYLNIFSSILILLSLILPFLKIFEGTSPFVFLFLAGTFLTGVLLLRVKTTDRKIVTMFVLILFAKVSWASVYFPYHDKHMSHYRNAAKEINAVLPANAILYDYRVDNPHLTYYLGRPLRLIDSIDDINIKAGTVILMKKETAETLDLQGFSLIGEVKARAYLLVLYKAGT